VFSSIFLLISVTVEDIFGVLAMHPSSILFLKANKISGSLDTSVISFRRLDFSNLLSASQKP
jgi:hypothetical protein